MASNDWLKLIVAAFLSALAKPIFDKILSPFIPSGKQIASFVKRTWMIFAGFIIPLLDLVFEFTTTQPVTKYFVLKIVLLVSIVLVNLNLALTRAVIDRVISLEKASNEKSDD